MYYLGKTLRIAFDEAVTRATDALKEEGFGVLTEIDVSKRRVHQAKRDAPF